MHFTFLPLIRGRGILGILLYSTEEIIFINMYVAMSRFYILFSVFYTMNFASEFKKKSNC